MEPLSRPVPPSSPGDRLRNWLAWFGVARLIAASFATMLVCAGAFWLVRSPAPPTEASLPRANPTATSLPDVVVPSAPWLAADGTEVGEESPASSAPLVVHVAGAVLTPGVYELSAGARVRDALVAAGGPNADADSDVLNLAAPLGDGTRVYVPVKGEETDAPLVSGGSPDESVSDAARGPLDVNRANAAELDELPGVGPATATAIVTERERNGPFPSVDDLERVPGIGPAKLAALRDLVTT